MTDKINQFNYEIPVLQAVIQLGGSGQPKEVFPILEETMCLSDHPEEYEVYKYGDVIFENKAKFARECLKQKGQLDCSEHGIWKITYFGKQRVAIFEKTGIDPDKGMSIYNAINFHLKYCEEILKK